MSENLKVIWREGMFLQPQHFQQAERFLSHNINVKMSHYQHYFFGITEVELDKENISNDTITIKRCTGVMPDGTNFSIPDLNKSPQSRSIAEHLKYDQQYLTLYLALPQVVTGKENVAGAKNVTEHLYRFKSSVTSVVDEVSSNQYKEIELGELYFHILFGDESRDGFTSIPIAQLIRRPDGKVGIQEEFIPPILQIGASHYFVSQIGYLLENIITKCNTLSQGRLQRRNGFAEFSISEETVFGILYTLNNYAPLINHYFLNPTIHPYELYSVLMMLAGGLSTFLVNTDITSFPSYDHLDLAGVLGRLLKTILSVLEKDVGAGCIIFPLEKVSSTTYTCDVVDRSLFSGAKFYLGVSSPMPDKELIVSILQRIKVGTIDNLDLIISSAMPGIPLINIINIPKRLSAKAGYIYFTIDTDNHLWNDVIESSNVSLYLPNSYPDLKMELIALKNLV